jgi:tRNA pseudouridine55 synthase
MDESALKTTSPELAAPSSSTDFKRPLSGLFAINKPSGVTSMSLLESLKELFLSSKLFVENPEPHQLAKGKKSRKNKYWQKKNQAKAIKIGQGGTLDPLASGVLIIGLNSGTKKLSNFLDCSKSYRSTGILGCKTDSYDSDGKTVGLSSWKHVKPDDIRKACQSIQGEHWQIPPMCVSLVDSLLAPKPFMVGRSFLSSRAAG